MALASGISTLDDIQHCFNEKYFWGDVMKKILFIVILVFLVISLGLNINAIREKNRNKAIMISNIYASIIEGTKDLDAFLEYVDENDLYNAKIQMEYATVGLIEIDNQLKYGSMYIDNRLYHPGILSFRFIGEGLMFGSNINGRTIKSVFDDSKVTDNEIEYVQRLTKDLKSIVQQITLEEPYIPDEELSIKTINEIFKSFYNTWSHVDGREESPYELIWK